MAFKAKELVFPAHGAKETATQHFASFLKANKVEADLFEKPGKPQQVRIYYSSGQDAKAYAEGFLAHYPEYKKYKHIIYLVPSHPETLAIEFVAK